jgi:predicted dithiol-disulfide oxidoreductase (DUF899 family)
MVTKHMTGTRKEWLAARLDLLEAEKELTRRSDELARRRQELPWVRLDKQYRFDTTATLAMANPSPRFQNLLSALPTAGAPSVSVTSCL